MRTFVYEVVFVFGRVVYGFIDAANAAEAAVLLDDWEVESIKVNEFC